MRLLLDTHAFLWWIVDSPKLSATAREVLSDGENELLLSAASSWEIAMKIGLGRIELPAAPEKFLADQMRRQRVTALPVLHPHAWRVAELPNHHRDPFDRLLIAQAMVEEVPLLTADPEIGRYDVETVW